MILTGAGVTLSRLPSDQLVQFGHVSASGNAVVRLEVQEVALLSSFWNVTGFHVPVCGETSCPFRSCALPQTSSENMLLFIVFAALSALCLPDHDHVFLVQLLQGKLT